jgi:hypothetical protein
MRMIKVLCVLAGIALILSCSSPSGGANSVRVVTGTISVPNSGYWSLVKLGVFSGGTLGTYPKLDASDAMASDVTKYRVVYYDNLVALGSDKVIPPLGGTSYTISDTTGISSAYSFELPATVPQYNGTDRENYYYAAWYDGGLTLGSLDLKNGDWPNDAFAVNGEFNRCATKVAANGSGKVLAIQYFVQSTDLNGNATGNYKYYGYSPVGSYNEYTELKDSSSGFNFAITATSGVW